MTVDKLAGPQVAEAGEHFVLYRLYMLGLVGGQAPRGMPETDLLVMRPDGSHVASVQVKTRSNKPSDGGWHMAAKHEKIVTPRLFYTFVGLETDPPLVYIIPSQVVARAVATAHRAWLAAPGLKGKPHQDSTFRRLRPDWSLTVPGFEAGWIDQYRDA